MPNERHRWISMTLHDGGGISMRETEIMCFEDERGQEGICRVYLQDGQYRLVKGKADDLIKLIGA